jgi:hypothetical protein
MKTRQEILDTLFNFTDTQKQKIDVLGTELSGIKDKIISLETYYTLTNVLREIDMIRENVMVRLINSMKRGDFLG